MYKEDLQFNCGQSNDYYYTEVSGGRRLNCAERRGLLTTVRLLSDKNQNLAEAQNLAFNRSILVLYPCLNPNKWVFPLVYSQHKLDSVVGDGV